MKAAQINIGSVFDTVGGETYLKSFKALRKDGIIVSMLEQPRPELVKQHGVNAISKRDTREVRSS